jgi:hypothetical protein
MRRISTNSNAAIGDYSLLAVIASSINAVRKADDTDASSPMFLSIRTPRKPTLLFVRRSTGLHQVAIQTQNDHSPPESAPESQVFQDPLMTGQTFPYERQQVLGRWSLGLGPQDCNEGLPGTFPSQKEKD